MWWLLLMLEQVTEACHPECRWQCDTSTVCPAVCRPQCQNPQCQVCYNNWTQCYATDRCNVQCPADQCEDEACPECETLCPVDDLCGARDTCQVQCEETQCAWQCTAPNNCPPPLCTLQCDSPACQAAGATSDLPEASIALTMFTLYLLMQ